MNTPKKELPYFNSPAETKAHLESMAARFEIYRHAKTLLTPKDKKEFDRLNAEATLRLKQESNGDVTDFNERRKTAIIVVTMDAMLHDCAFHNKLFPKGFK